MKNPTTPLKSITRRQINALSKLLKDRILEKRISDLEIFQNIINDGKFIDKLLVVLIKEIYANSQMIVRRVRVDRNRTPQEVLDATGRNKVIMDKSLIDDMPKGNGENEEVNVFFFRVCSFRIPFWRFPELNNEFEFCGLKPADPYSIAAVNEADPEFANNYPNLTYWQNDKKEWTTLGFTPFYSHKKFVVFLRNVNGVSNNDWWFAGVSK